MSSTVTIAICTFRRNEALTALVRTVAELAATELAEGSVRMLIVDDSPEGAAAATIADLASEVALELESSPSAAADISVARNRALASSMPRGDFIACLDDDCVPSRGWLRELVRIANEQEADVVVGHRQFVAHVGAPRWLLDEPFLAENLHYLDGSIPERGNTANMLIRSKWLHESEVRVRDEMGQVGGEDMVFFDDAVKAGATIRFAAHSVCTEPCEGRRATFRYQAWRQVWLGNNEAAINETTRQVSRARLAARAGRRVVSGVVHPFTRLARRRTPQLRWSVALVLNGIGMLIGIAGVRLRHRA